MKRIKRFISILLTVVMVLTMAGVTAVAADDPAPTTYTITIDTSNNNVEHTYEAYQIFKGRLENETLSDVDWGTGVNTSTVLSAVKALTKFTTCTNAAEVAKVLETITNNSSDLDEFAAKVGDNLSTSGKTGTNGNNTYVISGLPAGYYLVKDSGTIIGHDAYTKFMLLVVKDAAVTPKSSYPTVEKKVKENSNGVWQDGADYDIRDEVEFKLTGTLPDNLSDYKSYSYTFHDTLSSGLDYVADSVKIKIGGKEIPKEQKQATIVTTKLEDNTTKIKIEFKNLLGITVDGSPLSVSSSDEVIVTYKAKLNSNAVIAGAGNPNTVQLEFSNNPNGAGTGKTPPDKVTVFTYELVVNKLDESNKPLSGAGFTLYKKGTNDAYSSVKEIKAGTGVTTFTFTGLDSGKYKLSESTVPAGYNKIADIEFEIVAEYGTEKDDPTLTALVIKDKGGNIISGDTNPTFTVNLTPDDTNETPDDTNETPDDTNETPDQTNKNISTNITNHKGATLPETGGIGTTIFYIIGTILMLTAGIGLVVRRRMRRER